MVKIFIVVRCYIWICPCTGTSETSIKEELAFFLVSSPLSSRCSNQISTPILRTPPVIEHLIFSTASDRFIKMHYQSLVLIASLASSTLASSSLIPRQSSTCDQQRLTCGAAPGANQSLCASQKSSCDACEAAYESYITSPNSNKSLAASLRNECFAASAIGDGNGVLPIISSLTVAGTTPTVATSAVMSATSTSSAPVTTTTAASTCDQQRLECGSAPGANQSLCAVQKEACDACEAAYESYVTSPGSNKTFAASLREQCFAASKEGTGDGVVPIISTFSVAQAGGATATPTTGKLILRC